MSVQVFNINYLRKNPTPDLVIPFGLAVCLVLLINNASAAPLIQTWRTSGGAKVLFVAAPQIPMVDVRLVFDAGSARDGNQAGLAALTAAMLNEGAGTWDTNTIAERLEQIGAQLSASVDRDLTVVSLRSLINPAVLETALTTLATVLAQPTFPAAELERVRANSLVALHQDEEDPQTVGLKALYQMIFGDHPYASSPSGTPATLTAIRREDLIDFHKKYYQCENLVIGIVGALDLAAAQNLAEKITAQLPTGARAPALPAVNELTQNKLQQLPFTSTQTTVLAGQVGMKRGDPDYFPLYVGNYILGGSGLVSLLMNEVREKRGLSYNTFSSFLPLVQPGPFVLGLQTRNDQAEQAQKVLFQTLQNFINNGPTDAQLTAAKRNLTGGFPLKISSNGKIIQYLTVIGFYNLPLDYLDQFTARIEAVTVDQIRDAFQRRIHPDRLALVTVGPKTSDLPAAQSDSSLK